MEKQTVRGWRNRLEDQSREVRRDAIWRQPQRMEGRPRDPTPREKTPEQRKHETNQKRLRRARNPDLYREIDRRSQMKNRTPRAQRKRAAYWDDPERHRARVRAYKLANREAINARRRAAYWANRDEERKRSRTAQAIRRKAIREQARDPPTLQNLEPDPALRQLTDTPSAPDEYNLSAIK